MSVLQSIFLGIVQGITEFLPVSSSGHLAILENIFHIDTDGGMLFDIMLHVGTLAAVFVVYHKDIWRMIVETFKMIGDLFANLHIYMLNRIHKTSLKYRRVPAAWNGSEICGQIFFHFINSGGTRSSTP